MVKLFSQGDATQDLELDSAGNLKVETDLEGLRQKTVSRLRFFKSEWFLDRLIGVPYLQEILVKGTGAGKVAGIINTEILKESEITGINNVETSVNNSERTFSYSANINSIYGSFEVSV